MPGCLLTGAASQQEGTVIRKDKESESSARVHPVAQVAFFFENEAVDYHSFSHGPWWMLGFRIIVPIPFRSANGPSRYSDRVTDDSTESFFFLDISLFVLGGLCIF